MHRDTLQGVGLIIRPLVVLDSLEPDLTPVRRNRPRTIQPATRVLRLADDSLQHDAWLLHVQHLARWFVDDLSDRLADLNDTAAIGCHLIRIEKKTSVLAVLMNGLLNLHLRLDAHIFTGLEVKPARGSRRAVRNLAVQVPPCTAAQPLVHPVVEAFEAPVTTRHLRERSEEHTSELQSHHDLVCRL